ncbi:MAG: sugar ABC transporter permease [Sphingomonadales bacterium]|nr:sugar ABC transporter permease [Sphingomonadales bacterium]
MSAAVHRQAEARAGWLLSGPALVAIFVFFCLPAGAAVLLSLTDFDIYALANWNNLRFVGLGNYAALFTNPLFWQALKTTLLYVIIGTPLILTLSLGAAMLVNARSLALRGLWRAAFFAPYVTTLVATAVVWKYLLHTRYGMINFALGKLGLPAVDWLGEPSAAVPAIMLFVAWKSFGYNMVIFLAALQTVPRELEEAALIDGAGFLARLRHVTLPAIGPTVLLVAIMTVSAMFQLFTEPYVMTQGGPAQATITLPYFMYEEGFRWWSLGSGASVAVVLFLFILAVTAVQYRVAEKRGVV